MLFATRETKEALWLFFVVLLLGQSISNRVFAQSGPADLLGLTLEELFEAEISGYAYREKYPNKNRWHLTYRYQQSSFKDYKDKSTKRSIKDVMFVPGLEQRTAKNFPIVPKKITQEVHAFVLAYNVSDTTTLSTVVPFVYQGTDHVSSVPGYSQFMIRSKGMGDIVVLASQLITQYEDSRLDMSLGVSFPTGSIDERGDTPRAAGNQQLPYSMQSGSGTYDFPISGMYSQQSRALNWGVELAAKIRTGRNDRNYRLGHRFSASSWVQFRSLDWVEPSIKLAYQYWGRISGADRDLQVPGPFVFPSPVTNPNLYGGQQVDLVVAFKFPLTSKNTIELEVGRPVYQTLNGPQSSEEYQLGLLFDVNF